MKKYTLIFNDYNIYIFNNGRCDNFLKSFILNEIEIIKLKKILWIKIVRNL